MSTHVRLPQLARLEAQARTLCFHQIRTSNIIYMYQQSLIPRSFILWNQLFQTVVSQTTLEAFQNLMATHTWMSCLVFNRLTINFQGSKIVLVRSYLLVSQAAGQVNILIFRLKIEFSPCMQINFVMQGKCLFSDISRPDFISCF